MLRSTLSPAAALPQPSRHRKPRSIEVWEKTDKFFYDMKEAKKYVKNCHGYKWNQSCNNPKTTNYKCVSHLNCEARMRICYV